MKHFLQFLSLLVIIVFSAFGQTFTKATVHEIQFVDQASLLKADTLQNNASQWLLQASRKSVSYLGSQENLEIVAQVVVPPKVMNFTSGGYTLIVRDTAQLPNDWSTVFVRCVPADTSAFAAMGFLSIKTGDIVKLFGYVEEFPTSSMNSLTQFNLVTSQNFEILGSKQLPLKVNKLVTDFNTGINPGGIVSYSKGEPFEASYVTLKNLTVAGYVNPVNGTILLQDENGNQISTYDASKWFTLRTYKDPNSTYQLPDIGTKYESVSGIIISSGAALAARAYMLAPMFSGDMVKAAPIMTIRADMSKLIFGGFNPLTDSIVVNGSFNGWASQTKMKPNAVNPSEYEYSFPVTPEMLGTTIEFKFKAFPESKFSNNGWEADQPTNSKNREFYLNPALQTFATEILTPQISVLNPNPTVFPITFRVDMSYFKATNRFSDTNKVYVIGSFTNNWTSPLLMNHIGNNIYSITANIPSGGIEYKFKIESSNYPVGYEGNVGPGGDYGNRVYTVVKEDILPVVMFNNETGEPLNTALTFRVVMSVQAAKGLFNPARDKVILRGNFAQYVGKVNWEDNFEMTKFGADSAYSMTLHFPDSAIGKNFEYKFAYLNSTDGGVSWKIVWENDPNRMGIIPSGALTLPTVYFNNETGQGTPTALSFRVVMSVQAAKGLFNPVTDKVYVRGDFAHFVGKPNWFGNNFELTKAQNDSAYSITIQFPDSAIGKRVEYKFLYIGKQDTISKLENIPNRNAIIPSGANTLPTFYFNNEMTTPEPKTVAVTFQVNMNEYIRTGRFVALRDNVWLRGINDNWNPGFMMRDMRNTGIYTVMLPVNAHSTIQYKFWINTPNHANGGWEKDFATQSRNREANIGSGDSVLLPVVHFDDASSQPNPDVFSQNSNVKIEVDMRPAFYFRADSGYLPHTSGKDLRHIQKVLLNGPVAKISGEDWIPWDSVLYNTSSRQFFDDGTRGDAVAGDSVYTFTRMFNAGDPRSYIGKFGVNGLDNEASFGKNHNFNFADVASSTVKLIFGAVNYEGLITDDFGPSRENPGTYDDYIRIIDTIDATGKPVQHASVVRSGGYPEVKLKTFDITFNVNMNYYISQNKFTPAKDTIWVRGSFSEWNPIPMPTKHNGIYSVTLPFPDLSAIFQSYDFEYKYWFRNESYPEGKYEENVGPGTNGNRVFTYRNRADVLPVFYFNNEEPLIAGGWQIHLRITGKDATGKDQEKGLKFGVHPLATAGLDITLGEAELPPPPPAGILDARFTFPNSAITSLVDLRDTTNETKVWTLTYQPASAVAPITLTWEKDKLPSGSFILKDAITGTIINVNMKAQNSFTVTNTALTTLKIEYSSASGITIGYASGWNMLSIPFALSNMNVSAVFPSAISQAFGFNDGYQTVASFENKKGFWLKFTAPESLTFQGGKLSGTIGVPGGWTMIGVYEKNVPVNSITSTPLNIITSQFFGFDVSGYLTVDTLKAGKGYWVKTSQAGALESNLYLAKQNSKSAIADAVSKMGRITISDASGKNKVLYIAKQNVNEEQFQLPPSPPNGIFDIRYRSGSYAKNISAGEIVDIRGAVYPIRVRTEGAVVIVQDIIGGSIISKELKSGEEITIQNSALNSLFVKENITPAVYSLEQNYPNPFNPATVISYQLPVNSYTTLKIYDALGREIATLVNEEKPAGVHRVEFNAKNLSSNIYFYKLETGQFVQVKKMTLLK